LGSNRPVQPFEQECACFFHQRRRQSDSLPGTMLARRPRFGPPPRYPPRWFVHKLSRARRRSFFSRHALAFFELVRILASCGGPSRQQLTAPRPPPRVRQVSTGERRPSSSRRLRRSAHANPSLVLVPLPCFASEADPVCELYRSQRNIGLRSRWPVAISRASRESGLHSSRTSLGRSEAVL